MFSTYPPCQRLGPARYPVPSRDRGRRSSNPANGI